MHDLHNNIKAVRSIAPITVGTTGTGRTGKIVDTLGYRSVEAILSYGAITATGATITPTMLEGDTTGAMTSVADADLIGTEAAAGIAAGTPRTSGVNMNVTKKLGYRGAKRYVQLNVKSTVTAGTPISAEVVMGNPAHAPVA